MSASALHPTLAATHYEAIRGAAFRGRLYPGHRLGVIAWDATVRADDVLEAVDALFGADAWQPGFAHLWDGRRMTLFDLDLPGALRVGRRLHQLRDRIGMGPAAIVSVSDFHVLGVQLLVALGNVEDREVDYFPSLARATAWLGIPPELALTEAWS